MNRQETEDRPPLPSQPLSSGVLQSTVQAREMLNDLQEALPQISAPLNAPGEIEPDGRDNISDSGATTEPLAHDELENLPYWYKAQQVEKSLTICHVEKLRKQEEKQTRKKVERKMEEKQQRKKELQKKRLSTLRPRPSTHN
ncbi:conserved hypothetical protein [Histoplasma capsulatum H143]|uniref:Uncharacterized protein n=1 Tax=Ajellomyces capsulatus (strain H143) TaxID=544712 RepID=C6HDU9_AJECH|nr:conserved hypothetical protein [Histoplasma capsulatum H143]